jgi:cold shock CspA family protein/ribosome-associated translation inhibitor RaiA
MRVPLELTFRNVEKTRALEEYIRDQVRGLDQASDSLVSCRVAVEKPQEHLRSGSPYRVRIDLRLPPRRELVVRREAGEGDIHDDVRTVLSQAFEAARRKLLAQMARLRGEVKTPAAQEQVAFVVRLFPDEDYGFLKTSDALEYYFHRNSVLRNGFERLEIGTKVRFAAEQGEEGPQASTVEILGRPSPSPGGSEEPAIEPPLGRAE